MVVFLGVVVHVSLLECVAIGATELSDFMPYVILPVGLRRAKRRNVLRWYRESGGESRIICDIEGQAIEVVIALSRNMSQICDNYCVKVLTSCISQNNWMNKARFVSTS